MGLISQQYYLTTDYFRRVRRYNGFSVSLVNSFAIDPDYSDAGVTELDNGDVCHRYHAPSYGYMRVYVGFTSTVRTAFATTPVTSGEIGNYGGDLVRITAGVAYRQSGFTATVLSSFSTGTSAS